MDLEREASEQYAIAAGGCAFTDGYVCMDSTTEDFLTTQSQSKMLSGNLLKAWLISLQEFQGQSDQTTEQTNLKHFKIGFTEDASHYIVLFQGLLLPIIEQGQVSGVSRITLGRTTRYWIDKTSFEITKRLFYK